MSRTIILFSAPLLALSIASASAEWLGQQNESFLSARLDGFDKQIHVYEKIVDNGGWPSLGKGAKIEPGSNSERVTTLREILTITGDYRANVMSAEQSRYYDADLVEAVKKFQTRHGLEADGVVGGNTLAALNVPASDRLAQLKINADRLRNFAMSDTNPTSVVVNIPAYELYEIQNQKLADSMRVIVGAPKNKTPLMDNQITYLQFNPNWYVPSRIAANEMLPKIKRDPSYLTRAGYTVSQNGQSINPQNVDWDNYGRGNFPFRIVQKSGAGNALGKVKFHMPDSDAIYLHDTAKPQLFANADRALSHGCIRLENPLALAQFVLNYSNGTAPDATKTIFDQSKSERVELQQPLPVHIVYWTAWVDPNSNQPMFYRDVYNKDGQLMAEKKQEMNATQMASK